MKNVPLQYGIILLVYCSCLTGCFTSETLKKAKTDRKNEQASRVLSSYNDTNGNTTIIYTKRNKKDIYKIVVPAGSIISQYQEYKTIDWVNTDTTIANFRGVFYTENINGEKGFQRIICLNRENRLSDTSNLYLEIEKNNNLVTLLTNKVSIQVNQYDSIRTRFMKTKPAGFVLQPITRTDLKHPRQETYIIAVEPHRKKHTRYLLLPLTVALDALTSPLQILYFGTVFLLAHTIKY